MDSIIMRREIERTSVKSKRRAVHGKNYNAAPKGAREIIHEGNL